MGILCRYLDLLPPEARDRVLHARQWTTRCHADYEGARNLMGHAEDWSIRPGEAPVCGAPEVFRLRETAGDMLWTDEPRIGLRFTKLVQRRGLPGAVALIHARIRWPKRPRPRSAPPGILLLTV